MARVLEKTCIRPECGRRFNPLHKGHIFCSGGCFTAILHQEIGKTDAGMRPLGFMGNREKIQKVIRKYERLAKTVERV